MTVPSEFLAASAAAFEANVLTRTGGRLLVDVALRRADGVIAPYRLIIEAQNPRIRVREEKPKRLPASCPERHINQDSTFCMNWQDANPITVSSGDDTEQWWGTLLSYLRLQERAERLGRWPSKHAWAHGSAAIYQRKAEEFAAALGPRFEKAIAAGRLQIRRRRGFIRVFDGPSPLFSVWENDRRVATLRQRCPCGGSKLPVVGCEDHADRAAELAFALRDWKTAEARFWSSWKGTPCCGTFSSCPLLARNDDFSTTAARSAA